MRTLAIVNLKGGAGKSTLAVHLAVQSSGHHPTALLDLDPQGTSMAWAETRQELMPQVRRARGTTLISQLAQLEQSGMERVILDTPARSETVALQAVEAADLVLVPVEPGAPGIWSAPATVALIKASDKPFILLLNGAIHRARINLATQVKLASLGRVTTHTVHRRVGFSSAMLAGKGSAEFAPNSLDAAEIEALWRYLNDRLRKNRRSPQS